MRIYLLLILKTFSIFRIFVLQICVCSVVPYCGINMYFAGYWGFPGSSASKESTCNAGDPSSIAGLRRSAAEGIGHPLQYSWASLVAQTVKNLPAMWETWVWSLGWEDPLEKGMATHSIAWRIPRTEEPSWLQSMGSQRVGHDWATLWLTD